MTRTTADMFSYARDVFLLQPLSYDIVRILSSGGPGDGSGGGNAGNPNNCPSFDPATSPQCCDPSNNNIGDPLGGGYGFGGAPGFGGGDFPPYIPPSPIPPVVLPGGDVCVEVVQLAEGHQVVNRLAPVEVGGAALDLRDVDSPNLTQAVFQISGGAQPGDVLTLGEGYRVDPATGTIVGADGPTGLHLDASNPTHLVITGTAPVAVYEHVLESVTFRNDGADPPLNHRTLSIQVVDDTGLSSNVGDKTLQIKPDSTPLEPPVVDVGDQFFFCGSFEQVTSNYVNRVTNLINVLTDPRESVALPSQFINGTGVLQLDDQPREIRVQFHNEGAGYQNAIGYYVIGPDGSIGEPHIVFPNASIPPLTPGVEVSLGTFPPGTEVGFFLIQQGADRNPDPNAPGLINDVLDGASREADRVEEASLAFYREAGRSVLPRHRAKQGTMSGHFVNPKAWIPLDRLAA